MFIILLRLGVVNGPLKNEKSRQILPKSRSITQPSNGSRSLRFCVCWSHIYFSIKSLSFSVSVSDFKMPVSASLGFAIRHPSDSMKKAVFKGGKVITECNKHCSLGKLH